MFFVFVFLFKGLVISMPKVRKVSGAKKKAKEEAKKQAKARKAERPKIDPTFGLKNKKGKKNRLFVQNAKNNMNQQEIQKQKERKKQKQLRDMQLKQKQEMDALFKIVEEPKKIIKSI